MNTDYRDRISVAVWVVTAALAASSLLGLSSQETTLALGGRSLNLPFSANSIMPLLLALLAGSGAQAVVQAHPLARQGRLRFIVRFWALPIALTLIAVLVSPLAPSILYWAAGLLLFAILLGGVLAALYFSLDPQAEGYRRARAALNLACYGIALLLFLLIPASWDSLARSLVLGGIALLLALELLRGAQQSIRQVALYAAVVGVVVAETAWALALTSLSILSAGLLLLLLFYLLVGVAWQSLLERLTRRVILEFAAVALVGLLLILAFAP